MKAMKNKITARFHEKRKIAYAAVSMIATFAVLMYLVLPINDTFAYVPTTPEESGCNPETETDCFPDEIFTSDHPNNAKSLVLNGQFLSSNAEVDESEVIEMEEIVVKRCDGGTKGEVPESQGFVKSNQA